MKNRFADLPLLLCSIIVFIIDQLVKSIIQAGLYPGMSLPVWPPFFYFTYILNPGAAFGILENQRVFFLSVGILVFVLVAYFQKYLHGKDKYLRYGSALLLGGAAGNWLDRVRLGSVVDFFDFRIWPVFNIADIAIVLGVGLILYDVLFVLKAES